MTKQVRKLDCGVEITSYNGVDWTGTSHTGEPIRGRISPDYNAVVCIRLLMYQLNLLCIHVDTQPGPHDYEQIIRWLFSGPAEPQNN